ncbi:hypothetical protein B0T18DRAFT_486618 [Schizothecium vesticola]|uniref:Uncharacterized protein n=1 Tax=Schizothecium vesticola TaxID=314040 RepID=A0AA40F6Q3_9PEZI|nr:hypothetical protein B0T18DRAFT_486618 [Schizothecium vesticola]
MGTGKVTRSRQACPGNSSTPTALQLPDPTRGGGEKWEKAFVCGSTEEIPSPWTGIHSKRHPPGPPTEDPATDLASLPVEMALSLDQQCRRAVVIRIHPSPNTAYPGPEPNTSRYRDALCRRRRRRSCVAGATKRASRVQRRDNGLFASAEEARGIPSLSDRPLVASSCHEAPAEAISQRGTIRVIWWRQVECRNGELMQQKPKTTDSTLAVPPVECLVSLASSLLDHGPWSTDDCMRHFWPQDAPPLKRPTLLLTAPSGPESVLSRSRRRTAAWSCYTGPAAFRSTRRVPARTVATHAALCTNKRAKQTQKHKHAALRRTPAHAPVPGPSKRPDDTGRGEDEAPTFQPLRKAAERCPESQPSGPWAVGPACGILSSRPPSSPVCARTAWRRRRVAGGISFRLGHVDDEGTDSCQPAAGHLRVDAHHHAAVASTTKSPRHISRE